MFVAARDRFYVMEVFRIGCQYYDDVLDDVFVE